jgi:hypothetical protein
MRAMTTIRTSCRRCGEVELEAGRVTLRVCADDDSLTYTFHCPGCGSVVARLITDEHARLLAQSGARISVWRLPVSTPGEATPELLSIPGSG